MKKTISTAEFDRLFDEGKTDMTPYLDMTKARKINAEPKRINLDVPAWMITELDKHAGHIGVTRQSLIKMWLNDKLSGGA